MDIMVQKERGGGEVQVTVDQLARLAGTTTRTIRSLQTLGLLARPCLRGRTGLYGPEHLERLRAIRRLQDAGFSLGSIGVLFRAWEQGLTLDEVLGMSAQTARDAGPVADPVHDELVAFDDWPARGGVRAVTVVPTTVLELVAS